MKIKKIITLFAFFLLLSCGYQPIYSEKKIKKSYNFSISNIGFSGENYINQNLKNNLKNYTNIQGRLVEYDIIINSFVKKKITSKSQKGDPEIFNLKINITLEVLENNISKGKNSFEESFEYKNKTSKYELKKYEKNIQKNLTTKLSEDILNYLYSLK